MLLIEDNNCRVNRAGRVKGTILPPGDKSISHRAVLLSSLANGESSIKNFLTGEDCRRTLEAVKLMGVQVLKDTKDELVIKGNGELFEPENILDMGNSGTGIRLMSGVVSAYPMLTVLTGDASLRKRPMGRIIKPLMEMGAEIKGRNDGKFAPLVIEGGNLKGIHYKSPVASAQVKSAILLAGLRADGDTSVTEPSKSRDHTERMFKAFGVNVKVEGNTAKICPCSMLSSTDINVPGDISSAAFFIVAALILPDSEVIIENVGLNPTRTGIITALKMMGADLEIKDEREEGGEPVGTVIAKSSDLKGMEVPEDLVPSMIDEFPIFMIAASCADGTTVIKGAEELRVKESDRISVMAEEIEKMGVKLEEKPDGCIITGTKNLKGAVCNSHHDHRVAMSMIIAGLAAEGETIVEDVGWINTSFPTFFNILNEILM